MRLRNIPRAEGVLQAHGKVIKEETGHRGNWAGVFGNDRPVYIEIGMGKGQFLTAMAKRFPDRNFIGIERYSSVLLRAVERLDRMEEPPENIPVHLHGRGADQRGVRPRRGGGHLSQLLRPVAEEAACQAQAHLEGILRQI